MNHNQREKKEIAKAYKDGYEEGTLDMGENVRKAREMERKLIKEKIKGMKVPDGCCNSDSCADHRFAVGVNSTIDDILKNLKK